MNKIIYTIIIPHYNIPELLKRCLSSIPIRDDVQVVVVDDNSVEAKRNKLKILEKEYSNVQFIYSSTNGGGGRARNIGMQYAKGEYILFADADDFFNYCINDILDKYVNEAYDVVYFNANYINSDTYLITNRYPILNKCIDKYQKTKDISTLKYLFGEPWGKLIKRSLIVDNKIKFDETPIHNDTKFSYRVSYHSKIEKIENIAIYSLADRAVSVSKKLTDEKYGVRTRVFAEKNRFLIDHDIKIFDTLMLTPFWHYLLHGDTNNFGKCLSIAKEYGFNKFDIISKMIYYKLRGAVKLITGSL